MSGLYNMVFGERPFGPTLIALLQRVQPFEVGRYRDAWVESDGDVLLIRVHTRNGGGNREDCDDGSMQRHPWYVRDEDQDFDNTYADYWFRPDLAALESEVREALVLLVESPVDMGAKWTQTIEGLRKGVDTDRDQGGGD